MNRILKMAVPMIKLNNGLEMPIVGLGTWKVITAANVLKIVTLLGNNLLAFISFSHHLVKTQ